MVDTYRYVKMQRDHYNAEASNWSLGNKDPVVGAWSLHENHKDYDEILFKGPYDTKDMIALDYGCGPGRCIVRFAPRFKRIDGVDISEECIARATTFKLYSGLADYGFLSVNDGMHLFGVADNTYDMIYSVICLQHICVRTIRLQIMKEIFRVLKPGGYFCFQMGFGGRPDSQEYYDEFVDANGTNGARDVTIRNEKDLQDDLANLGFSDYLSDLREPCSDRHAQWIWVQCRKPLDGN